MTIVEIMTKADKGYLKGIMEEGEYVEMHQGVLVLIREDRDSPCPLAWIIRTDWHVYEEDDGCLYLEDEVVEVEKCDACEDAKELRADNVFILARHVDKYHHTCAKGGDK